MIERWRIRRGTAADAAANNVVLQEGEPGWTTDTHVLKIGDGVTPWNDLPSYTEGLATEAAVDAALAEKATPQDIADAVGPVSQDVALRATKAEVARQRASNGGLYFPSESAWLKWRARRAAVLNGGAQGHIAVIGDSIAHGAGVTSPRPTNSWPGKLRDAINARYGDGGTGIVIANATVRANVSLDPRWKFAGTITDQGFGFHQSATYRLDAIAGTYVEFTATCDEFVIYNLSGTAGFVNVTIDGGPAKRIRNLWGSGGAVDIEKDASYKQIVTRVPAGAYGQHTIRVYPDTDIDTKDIFLLGVEGRTAGTGTFKVSNASISSKSLSTLFAGNNMNDEVNGLYGLPMVDMLRADLLVIALGINDWQNTALSAATFKEWLRTLVRRQRASGNNGSGSTYANGDALLLWNPQPDLTTIGGPDAASRWAAFRDVYYQIADEEDVPLLDLGGRWKDFTSGNSIGFFNDGIHPNNSGSLDIAGAVERAVMAQDTHDASPGKKADKSYVDSGLAAKLDTSAANSTFAAQSLIRDMAYQRNEPLHPNYTWVPTTMPCICIGQDPATGTLWGVNQTTNTYATSTDNGGTWVDGPSRTNNPVSPGGIMDMVSAGPYVVMNTDTGMLYRTAKTSLFGSFGEVSPTDARVGTGLGKPAGTTGRVQVFANNDVTTGSGGKQSVWLYGNYNAAASGSWPGAMIWRSLDYGSTWTRVLNVTQARHVHAIRFDKSDPTLQTVWATIGDDVALGAGLYKSTDAGATWTKVSSNRYGISLDFMAATGIYPARVIIEGDGTAQPHIFTFDQVAGNATQDPAVWFDGAPLDGKGSWKGSVRALKVTTEGNLFYASTGEGGAIGTRDGLWLAKGPHFENAVLLQEYTGGTIPSWRRTVEAGGFIINGNLRAPRPRFRSDV